MCMCSAFSIMFFHGFRLIYVLTASASLSYSFDNCVISYSPASDLSYIFSVTSKCQKNTHDEPTRILI